MIEVTIDGIKTKVPQCTCGKCIVRRLRKDFFENLPYSKDMGSTYTKDYPWKNPYKNPIYYNRSQHTGWENSYKPAILGGHISEMKDKFRPYETDPSAFKKVGHSVTSKPFIGNTTYDLEFPNWGSIASSKTNEIPYPAVEVPLRGESDYHRNYIKYPDKYYKMRDPYNFNHSNMRFYGDIKPDTTYRTSYKPIDLNQPNYFPKERDENPNLKSNAFLNPNAPPENTTYKEHYVPYDHSMCELRKYLNARGMPYLVI
ncbi:MAG: hypothetical protein MJ252_11455 [archaeon]|nr:hypothetical protein [archaeon]